MSINKNAMIKVISKNSDRNAWYYLLNYKYAGELIKTLEADGFSGGYIEEISGLSLPKDIIDEYESVESGVAIIFHYLVIRERIKISYREAFDSFVDNINYGSFSEKSVEEFYTSYIGNFVNPKLLVEEIFKVKEISSIKLKYINCKRIHDDLLSEEIIVKYDNYYFYESPDNIHVFFDYDPYKYIE